MFTIPQFIIAEFKLYTTLLVTADTAYRPDTVAFAVYGDYKYVHHILTFNNLPAFSMHQGVVLKLPNVEFLQ